MITTFLLLKRRGNVNSLFTFLMDELKVLNGLGNSSLFKLFGNINIERSSLKIGIVLGNDIKDKATIFSGLFLLGFTFFILGGNLEFQPGEGTVFDLVVLALEDNVLIISSLLFSPFGCPLGCLLNHI